MMLLEDISQLSTFGRAFLYILGGSMFVLLGLTVAKILAPNRPNPEKLTTYECGEDPIGESGIQFNMRFYVVALIFLIFEVEILFLFPWATVFADIELVRGIPSWGIVAMIEMLLFVGILLLGLVYIWVKGDLAWVKPQPLKPQAPQSIPLDKYEQINLRYQGIRAPQPMTEK